MASFKTAYLQREVVMDIDVVKDCKVGDFVVVTPETSTVQGYMTKATQTQLTGKQATHIVAQSDQTLAYGHVPVENRDYRYDPTVAQTVGTAPSGKTTTWKHVALFKIINWDDVTTG